MMGSEFVYSVKEVPSLPYFDAKDPVFIDSFLLIGNESEPNYAPRRGMMVILVPLLSCTHRCVVLRRFTLVNSFGQLQ